MQLQSNAPVSPLSIMEQQQRYKHLKQGLRHAGADSGDKAGISQYTINRVIQEVSEAAIRNLGTIVVE